MMPFIRLVAFLSLASFVVFASCKSNECTYSDVACDGNVMVFCGSSDQDPTLRVQRRSCESGEMCAVGYYPHAYNPIPYVFCFPDLGPDPACAGSIGYCKGDEPVGCRDGHALQIIASPCSPGTCSFEPSAPGSWPSCGIPDAGRQFDLCEDQGDGVSCGIWFPHCDGGLTSCYTGWHVSAACCSQAEVDAGTCAQKPFRRVDGSIVERAGGFTGCQLVGMSEPRWCCTEIAP
jgi:hypothetical protein